MKNFSSEIANAIRNFLDTDDWRYYFDEKKGLFRFGLDLHSKLKSIDYIVDVKQDEFLCYAIAPVAGDEKDQRMISSLADFVCRANYGLKNGNFELDVRDGEIRYKSYVDCDGQIPAPCVIKNSIYCTASMFKRYAPGFLGIIFGDMSAKEAIDRCEGSGGSHEQELRAMLESSQGEEEGGSSESLEQMFEVLASRLGLSDGGMDEGNDTEGGVA